MPVNVYWDLTCTVAAVCDCLLNTVHVRSSLNRYSSWVGSDHLDSFKHTGKNIKEDPNAAE